MMGFVLWYVIDRRAKMRATPSTPSPVAAQPVKPAQPAKPAVPVDLAQHDNQTIDFSSGQPVVKNSPEDQAAIDAALKDMAEATNGVTFEAAPKKPGPAPPGPPGK